LRAVQSDALWSNGVGSRLAGGVFVGDNVIYEDHDS